ncbi:MAG: hypothetical protein R2883_04520 [Caldisericia bacterium]
MFLNNVCSDIKEFLKLINCYVTLEDINIPESDIPKFTDDLFAQKAVDGKIPGNPSLTREKVARIFSGKYRE